MAQSINVGRFNRLLQRFFEVKAEAPVTELAGEIMPVLSLDDGLELERYWISGQRTMAVCGIIGASVGNNSSLRLRNPAGSGVLATVLYCNISVNAASEVGFRKNDATGDQATIITPVNVDTRDNATNGGAVICSHGNGASSGSHILRGRLPADVPWQIMRPFAVLTPGYAVDFDTNNSTNIAVTYSVVWRERALEPSEAR